MAVLRLPNNQWIGPLKHVHKSTDISRIYISVLVSDERLQETNIPFIRISLVKSEHSKHTDEMREYFIYELSVKISDAIVIRVEQKLNRNKHWRKVPISLAGVGINPVLKGRSK